MLITIINDFYFNENVNFCSIVKKKYMYSKVQFMISWWCSGTDSDCQSRRHKRHGCNPWIGKSHWSRKWLAAPVSWLGKSHGQRALVGYSPLGCKESDMIEHIHTCKEIDVLQLLYYS